MPQVTNPTTAPVLDGLWQMVRAELDGNAAPDLITHRTTLELNEGAYLVRFHGQVLDQGTFALDEAGLTLHGTAGPNAGRRIPCIYQQVGDRLRICYGIDGSTPDAFTTTGDRKRYLATYRRV